MHFENIGCVETIALRKGSATAPQSQHAYQGSDKISPENEDRLIIISSKGTMKLLLTRACSWWRICLHFTRSSTWEAWIALTMTLVLISQHVSVCRTAFYCGCKLLSFIQGGRNGCRRPSRCFEAIACWSSEALSLITSLVLLKLLICTQVQCVDNDDSYFAMARPLKPLLHRCIT